MASFGNPTAPANAQTFKETELAAGAFGMKIQYLEVQSPKEIEPALQAGARGTLKHSFIYRNPLTTTITQIAEVAIKNRLPTMYPDREYVEAGGLMSYGQTITICIDASHIYVDKILKGTKPADLPVEQPQSSSS